MVRWFRLFGNQYLGFWVLGLFLFALQEVPYILMPLFHLETNPIMTMTETSVILDISSRISLTNRNRVTNFRPKKFW